ncbi:MAG: hypothetical protein JXB29_00810 [Sedimentisphaerales bacterium]|nr:hypothetical protein [Sedimentisphaerales bacterium]
MRNVKMTILFAMLVCCSCVPNAQATTVYDSGGTWDIDFEIYGYVDIYDNVYGEPTVVNLVDGGLVWDSVQVYDNSEFNIFGGWIEDYLNTYENSKAYISGGMVGGGFYVYQNSDLTIEGTGFNYPYGTYTDKLGRLTGTLANGDPINTIFYIHQEATMTLVPEAATLLLLGLGTLMLRKKQEILFEGVQNGPVYNS